MALELLLHNCEHSTDSVRWANCVDVIQVGKHPLVVLKLRLCFGECRVQMTVPSGSRSVTI